MAELVPLRAGDLAVDLAPGLGGAVVAFTRGPERILRETPPTAISDRTPNLAGSYTLMPYSNRIADGRFSFGGETFTLAKNFGKSPHSIHGNAWQRTWTVARAEPSEALLTLDHDPTEPGRAEEWPFAYHGEQEFVLMPDSLTVTLRLRNDDRRPMPAGFGVHPYFDRPGATLQFSARTAWEVDERMMPTRRVPVPDRWNADRTTPVDDLENVDNVFEGWGGEAEVTYPERNLLIRMKADPIFGKLVFFRTDERSFFSVEPVSHTVDAVNRMDTVEDHGLRVLEPGESIEGRVTLAIGSLRER